MIDFKELLAMHLASGGQIHRFGKPTPGALDCEHLREPTGESVKVKNCGCGAMTMLYECDLMGLCAPLAKSKRAATERADVTLCRDCEHNPANLAATK